MSYAAVPLYKMFCAATGWDGTPGTTTMEDALKMVPVEGARPINVNFSASTSDTLSWRFRPAQRKISVLPGETALAFYTAENTSDGPITGVASYNVTPLKAGLYLRKVQCFCFDYQRLKPGEEVDMPVFLFIDPEILEDEAMRGVTDITLGYTFFKAEDREQ